MSHGWKITNRKSIDINPARYSQQIDCLWPVSVTRNPIIKDNRAKSIDMVMADRSENLTPPESQDPLKGLTLKSPPTMSSNVNRLPVTGVRVSFSVSMMADTTIMGKMKVMTSRARMMPRQFRWFGAVATSSCNTETGEG